MELRAKKGENMGAYEMSTQPKETIVYLFQIKIRYFNFI